MCSPGPARKSPGQEIRGCLLAGPGRGDCEHFIGLPKEEKYPETVDEYGRPRGWCQVCWLSERITRLQRRLHHRPRQEEEKAQGWVSVEELVTMGSNLCIRCLSEKGLQQTHAKVIYRGHSLCLACLAEVSKMETTIGQWDFSCVNYHRDLEADVIKKLTPGGKANAG